MNLQSMLRAAGLVSGLLVFAVSAQAGYQPGCSVRLDLGVGPTHAANAVALQPDGRIVVAGYVDLGGAAGRDFLVARFHPDLTLDTSFAGTGYIVQDFFGSFDEAADVAIQTDGKILVGGYATDVSGAEAYLAMARYLPNGALDAGFGAVTRDLPGGFEAIRALALQPDGDIVAVGYESSSGQHLFVARFLKDGTWDASFDADGLLQQAVGDSSLASAVRVTPSGEIVVAGSANVFGDSNVIALRILTDGTLDTTFNGSGWVMTDIDTSDIATGVAVDMSNQVIVAGTSNARILVVRYRANGLLDSGFGTGGVQTHGLFGSEYGNAVAIEPLGIVVVGVASGYTALTRFSPSDGTNNLAVQVTTFFNSAANAIVIRDDGKYVVAGTSTPSGVDQLTVALFNPDGSQDCSERTLHPQADSATGFTPVGSCVSNWDCVNDQPGNAAVEPPVFRDGNTSYVTSATPGAVDRYRLVDGALPAGKVVSEIEIFAEARRGSAATHSVRLLYHRVGIDAAAVQSPALAVPTTGFSPVSHRWTGLNWDTFDLDTLEIGVEHVMGDDLVVSQLYVTLTLSDPQIYPVSSFAASASGDAASGSVALNWLNPSYGAYDETVIVRDSGGCPADPSSGFFVAAKSDALGSVGSFVDNPPHGLHYYTAFVEDTEDHFSAGECLKVIAFDRGTDARDWVYSTSDPTPALSDPGLLVGTGIAYATTNDGRVHAMNAGPASTGGGQWPSGWKPVRLGAIAPSRPPIVLLASGDWAALFGAKDGRVYAINATSGALLWRSARLGPMLGSAPAAILSAYGAAQDLVFIGTRNSGQPNQFYALNGDDGTVAWSYDPGPGPNAMGMVTSSPIVDYTNKRVTFTSFQGAPSGRTLWCIDFSAAPVLSPCGSWPDFGVAVSGSDIDASPILFGGTLYVSDTAPGDLYAVSPVDGTPLLLSPLGPGGAIGYVFPQFGTPNVILSTSSDVQSVDTTTGSGNWTFPILTPSTPLQVPFSNDIYVGGGDGLLHHLSTITPGGPGTTTCIGDCSNMVGSATYDVLRDMIYVGSIGGEISGVKTPF